MTFFKKFVKLFWMPILYAATFLIVVGASSKLSMHGATLAVFWAGLGAFTVGGIALALYLRARRRGPVGRSASAEEEPEARKKSRKKDRADTERYSEPADPRAQYSYPPYYPPYPQQPYQYPPQYQYPPYPPQNGYSQSQPVPPQAAQPQTQSQPTQPQTYDVSDLERKYFSDGAARSSQPQYDTHTTQPQYAPPQEYGRTASRADEPIASSEGADALWRRLTGNEVPDEQPMIFRTRRDPDVFVYEYSDRYQYWRRTKAGMVLESTEYKTRNDSIRR